MHTCMCVYDALLCLTIYSYLASSVPRIDIRFTITLTRISPLQMNEWTSDPFQTH